MRVPLRWLSEYIDLPTTDVDELARAFDMLGHAVEEVDHVTAGWSDVVIGRVARIEAHPDADQIRITHVDLGDGELQQIICGAWNFEEGATVPVAVPGAVLPGEFAIGRRSIRGIESNGMICSERELGLGEVHEGIMVLDSDAPIGVPLERYLELPDTVFDLEVTNNRPDVMGMVGVARELAAWFDTPVRDPGLELTTVPGAPSVAVTISAADGCNRFVGREIRGVTVGPSPVWMRERLRRCGVRAISNVVDVSNYVMLEMGHPLHAFDADRIAGNTLDVRWAVTGESLTTLDGVVRPLTERDLVIVDADGPTSLAAVMGGARSEVGPETSRVLMEAASWHPATVMYTSRRHDLRSEASARFERGVDPNLAPDANARACRLLVEIGGGEIAAEAIDVVANAAVPVTVSLAITEVRRILGDRFTVAGSASLLRRLGFEVAERDDRLEVVVPTRRPDVTRQADLIEELARLSDYDTFDATLPTGPAGGLTVEQVRTRRLQELLRGGGLSQAINLPFVSPSELIAFNPEGGAEVVTVRNPLRDDQAKLRQHLLPALLRNVRDNLNRGASSVALFETGRVFYGRPDANDVRVPHQPTRLGIVVAGDFGPHRVGSTPAAADAASALSLVQSIGDALGVRIARRPEPHPGLHPKRSATLEIGGTAIGLAGELHPDVAAAFEIDVRVAVVELDLRRLVSDVPHRQMAPLSTYPHVDFDLSFDVPAGVAAADILAHTTKASTLVEAASVFDEYRPEGSDLRSIAIRYRLRAPDRTLSGEEIATNRQSMIEAAAAAGAELRGSDAQEA